VAKAELKTKPTEVSAADFIAVVPDERRREEAAVIDALHRRVTGHEPKLWGPSIIGYGSYSYKYDSGREGTMCRGGFSPRKAAMTVYLMGNYFNQAQDRQVLPLHQQAGRCGPGRAGRAGGAQLAGDERGLSGLNLRAGSVTLRLTQLTVSPLLPTGWKWRNCGVEQRISDAVPPRQHKKAPAMGGASFGLGRKWINDWKERLQM
jgi:hypothetical protein